MNQSLQVWIGSFGQYEIPAEFRHVRITQSGWPDKRAKDYAAFVAWAKSVDVA